MATTIEKFDSTGGFSIDKTTVVDELRNAKDLNTIELKNSNYTDSRTTNYILRGLNTSTLDLDGLGTQIPIPSNTINFVTAHIIAVNATGTVYATKFETSLFCNSVGNTTVQSTFQTVIKDDIPTGETWFIQPVGALNRFSYSTTRAGTTSTIKWIAKTEVVSIDWA
tara:strand:+ start:1135 stop:1635 length:501 start_codon:yes stop_codon:yes gene_type:complete